MFQTVKKTIPGYNWGIEVVDITLNESDELHSLLTDETAFKAKILSYIVSWGCTDREGKPLPITVDSLRDIPQTALNFIIMAIRNPLMDDDPKNDSGRLPSSQPGTGEASPNIQIAT